MVEIDSSSGEAVSSEPSTLVSSDHCLRNSPSAQAVHFSAHQFTHLHATLTLPIVTFFLLICFVWFYYVLLFSTCPWFFLSFSVFWCKHCFYSEYLLQATNALFFHLFLIWHISQTLYLSGCTAVYEGHPPNIMPRIQHEILVIIWSKIIVLNHH